MFSKYKSGQVYNVVDAEEHFSFIKGNNIVLFHKPGEGNKVFSVYGTRRICDMPVKFYADFTREQLDDFLVLKKTKRLKLNFKTKDGEDFMKSMSPRVLDEMLN